MNIKQAFTFAELMISLVVIAIITAILYPTISELAPNNNAHLFKATYKTIEMVISEIVQTRQDGAVPRTANALCNEFATRLNIIGGACNYIQTSNGVRWVFEDNGIIYVDVNASNNKIHNADADDQDVPDKFTDTNNITGAYMPADTTVRDTFIITVTKNGKITVDNIAAQHLKGLTD